jgi:hypothetical protein
VTPAAVEPGFTFHLGTHVCNWIWSDREAFWPWFVSHRTLRRYVTLRRSTAPWALDSGGFTELSMFGRWETTPAEYVAAVRRYRDEIGSLMWAAPQDWMCEPSMLDKTGLTVHEHQQRTVDNLIELRNIAPDLPIIPVLQGWAANDYRRHVAMYADAGIDLFSEPLVGMGTFCRRATYGPIIDLVAELHGDGLRMHGFGLKSDGISRYGWALASADSLAWSFTGRYGGNKCGRPHRAKSCANCRDWAEMWARHATSHHGTHIQPMLPGLSA